MVCGCSREINCEEVVVSTLLKKPKGRFSDPGGPEGMEIVMLPSLPVRVVKAEGSAATGADCEELRNSLMTDALISGAILGN